MLRLALNHNRTTTTSYMAVKVEITTEATTTE